MLLLVTLLETLSESDDDTTVGRNSYRPGEQRCGRVEECGLLSSAAVLGKGGRPPGSFRGIGAAVVVGIQNDDDEHRPYHRVSKHNRGKKRGGGILLWCFITMYD